MQREDSIRTNHFVNNRYNNGRKIKKALPGFRKAPHAPTGRQYSNQLIDYILLDFMIWMVGQ